MSPKSNLSKRLYVASFNGGKSDVLLQFRFDATNGTLLPVAGTNLGVQNPIYLEIDPSHRFLYVADVVGECDGKPGGAVCAYAIDPSTGALRFLNRRSSGGAVPCYITVSATGKFLLVANYTGGTVASLPVNEDGSLGDAVSVHPHAALATGAKRNANAHSVVLDAANRFGFAGELGIDKVVAYRFDAVTGKLTVAGSWDAPPGAGPRHFTFHPNGRFAYLINEHGSTVVAFAYDASTGKLTELQTSTTLPAGFSGKNYTADLHAHPNGKFLYGSNRGHDSIVIFAIDTATGRLTLVGHEPTQGSFPRSFVLDSSGTFLLVGNEKSHNIVSFRIDAASGKLSPAGHVTSVPAPACLCFARG